MKCYHLTNPLFLEAILKEGLRPMVGESTLLNHDKDIKPCIFLSITYVDRFDSTYPEDILLEVLLPDNTEYQYDPKHKGKKWIMVFEPIPPSRLSVYKGLTV